MLLSSLDTLIDEFDNLVDSGLEDRIRALLDQYLEEEPLQVIFASATVSKQMRKIAAGDFGDGTDSAFRFKELIEKSIHMNLQHLKNEFVSLADFNKLKPLKLSMKI